MKKLGFALGAGGARGVAHIGFLQAMDEEGICPDYIGGSSMGSVVGACYAKGMNPQKMREICRQLKMGDIVDVGLRSLSKLGLMKWTKVRKMMSEFLENSDFSDLKIPFCCVAVDVKKAKLHTFSEGSVVEAILASSSIPTVFRPVEKDGMLLVDGGVLCRVPAKQVKKMGADIVVGIDVLGDCGETEKISNIFSLIVRIYDIMDAQRAARDRRELGKNVDLWIEPDLGFMSQYQVKYQEEAYEAGYAAGKANADKIRKLIED